MLKRSHFITSSIVAGTGLLGLMLATSGCSSDSPSSGSGGESGSSSAMGGSGAGGKSMGGSSTAGSSEAGATANGGSSAGNASTGGNASGGATAGGNTGSGGGIWGCVEAGGACICQNNTDKEHESVCTNTYKCCVTVPFAGALRCQCQDPGDMKCEAPAGSGAMVVDKCPP